MLDKYGREITYLRISVIDNCNLNCTYCNPSYDKTPKLTDDDILKIVKASVKLGITKFRLTGGEPLVRKGIVDLIGKIKKIHGVKELTLTTNGVLLKDMAKDLKDNGLDRINISLDTLDEIKYKMITGYDKLLDVIKGIDECEKVGLLPIKINTVLYGPHILEEIPSFIELAMNRDITIRFIELMPIGCNKKTWKSNYISSEDIIKTIPNLEHVTKNDIEVADNYRIKGSKGKIGFIKPISNKFCDECNKLRLTSSGHIKPCLHSNDEISIMDVINNEEELMNTLKRIIIDKPLKHEIGSKDFIPIKRSMNQIGG